MSKDGMTGFLLMVEVEKINIENNFIEYDQTQGRRVYPVQMSWKILVGLGVFICKLCTYKQLFR